MFVVSPVDPNIASAIAINRALIIALSGLFTALIVGLFAVIRTRPLGQASAQTALNGTMETLVKSLSDRITSLEKERDRIKADHEACEQRYRALEQHLYSIEEFFRRNGFDIPKRPQPDVVLFLDKPRDPSQTDLTTPLTEDTSDA